MTSCRYYNSYEYTPEYGSPEREYYELTDPFHTPSPASTPLPAENPLPTSMATPGAKKARPGQKPRATKDGGGSYKIAGIELACDPDLEFDKPTPTPLFPTYHPAKPKPLTKDERIQVARFRSLRKSIHEGPLYTVLGDNVRVGKSGSTSSAATFDPFEGMPTYSKKYMKQRRRIPKLDTRPYVLKFFPKELWSTLDPSSTTNGASAPQTTKKLRLTRPDGLKGFDEEIDGENEDTGAAVEKHPDDDEEGMEEEVDDEYDEDEDEGGDYNAEQYFDDGGDDAGDDYDGGEDGGGDYY